MIELQESAKGYFFNESQNFSILKDELTPPSVLRIPSLEGGVLNPVHKSKIYTKLAWQ